MIRPTAVSAGCRHLTLVGMAVCCMDIRATTIFRKEAGYWRGCASPYRSLLGGDSLPLPAAGPPLDLPKILEASVVKLRTG